MQFKSRAACTRGCDDESDGGPGSFTSFGLGRRNISEFCELKAQEAGRRNSSLEGSRAIPGAHSILWVSKLILSSGVSIEPENASRGSLIAG